MRKHVYTCPDVIHYRKNQYRLAIWSNVFSIAYMGLFFGGLKYLGRKTSTPAPLAPVETQE